MLDSGAWPEHPSLADQGNLARPPRRFGNTPRPCDFGDNPLTPADDVFVCNNKLIGGQTFLTAYLSNPARAAAEAYKTARDSNGHGTHTGTTSAGNVLATAPVLGVDRGPISGIAPGAWVSVYKVCGAGGCFSSDSAAAVQQAILDGVDVINFSISGGTNPATDPVELAFLDAYAAGVFVVGLGRQRRARSSDGEPPVAVGDDGCRIDPDASLPVHADGQRDRRRHGHHHRCLDHGRASTPRLARRDGVGGPVLGHPVPDPRARRYCSPARSSPVERGVNARVEKGYNVARRAARPA